MGDNSGRVGATVVAIGVAIVVFLLILRPGAKTTEAPSATHRGPVAGQRRYRGEGDRGLGTIHLSTDATATFSCPQCLGHGFAITSHNPANPADGLNDLSPSDASAQFAVTQGTYSDVRVQTDDEAWTLTITPTAR